MDVVPAVRGVEECYMSCKVNETTKVEADVKLTSLGADQPMARPACDFTSRQLGSSSD